MSAHSNVYYDVFESLADITSIFTLDLSKTINSKHKHLIERSWVGHPNVYISCDVIELAKLTLYNDPTFYGFVFKINASKLDGYTEEYQSKYIVVTINPSELHFAMMSSISNKANIFDEYCSDDLLKSGNTVPLHINNVINELAILVHKEFLSVDEFDDYNYTFKSLHEFMNKHKDFFSHE